MAIKNYEALHEKSSANGSRPAETKGKIPGVSIICSILLAAFTVLTAQSASAQDYYHYGFSYNYQAVVVDGRPTNCAVVTRTDVNLPAFAAGLREGDVITAVDGQPAQNRLGNLSAEKKVTLSVRRIGNHSATLEMYGVPCLTDNRVAESVYARRDRIGEIMFYATRKTLDIEPIVIMSDPDVDYFKYGSFDFEFTGENVMYQKEIAPVLESHLTSRGLVRDRENPDMLVFIEYYSDRREQYVPPTQATTTRYGTFWNWSTQKVESRQFVESYQTGNYTQVDYLSKMSVSIADAKMLAKGDGEKARIWQADYEVVYKKKADHKKFAENIGAEMLAAFPFKADRITIYSHYYTGIVYDGAVAGRVNGVMPGSPADKAGIKAGDIIAGSSWGKNTIFKKSYDNLYEKVKDLSGYHFNYADFELTRASNTRYENAGYVSPFMSTYMSCYQKRSGQYTYDEVSHGSDPLVFTVKSGSGATKKITVDPIIVRERVFDF